jgi:hypothetical protein
MIVHSDGIGTLVLFLGLLASGAILLTTLVFLACGPFRQAKNIFRWWRYCAVGYATLTIAVSLLTPQTIVNPGESYCEDIWCISIQTVSKTQLGHAIAYKAGVRLFSDANTVKTSARGASLYLVDEHNRRFSLFPDSTVPPFDIELNPGQSVNTSLTFSTAPDAQQLFLRVDWPNRSRLVKFLVKFAIGNDSSLFHRPTLLRVQ